MTGNNEGDGTGTGIATPSPAATVVLLRDGATGVEALMLHRTSKVHFGGMWVFPGGRIDPGDHPPGGDLHIAARNAAARETREETGVEVTADDFVSFAHWTPSVTTPVRYATWFFATHLRDEQRVSVDGHEIQNHEWIHPAAMIARHTAGEVDLAPPTWVTLHHLSLYHPVSRLLSTLEFGPRRIYQTRIGRRADGVPVAMWFGDAGYDDTDPDAPGERHRLVMDRSGYTFENTVADY
jgi:8-oxo-dGTP pyrophosphatase MutT (NUDIX family)